MGQLRTCNRRSRRLAAFDWMKPATRAATKAASAVVHPVVLVDTADIPSGGELHLLRCGGDFSIQFGSEELMGSVDRNSEELLARMTCERLSAAAPRILIGGLGMGFTLAAALAALPADARIVIAEVVPRVVEWAQGPLAHIVGPSLDDPRVTLEIRDVHDVIVRDTIGFDGIILDVDNGPDGLIQPENDRLYCNWGLRAALRALRPDGVLAIWSAYPDPVFADRLAGAGFVVDEASVRSCADRDDDWHTLWFASRSVDSPNPAKAVMAARAPTGHMATHP